MKLLTLLSLLVLLASCNQVPPTGTPITSPSTSNVTKEDAMIKPVETKMELTKKGISQEETSLKLDKSIKQNGYMDYSSELAASAMKSGQTVVLFFAASWCPSCLSLDKTIESDLGSIPTDTLILRVNYDDSTDLKKKYGVVTQHTTIVLNTDGTLKSKKIGAQKVSDVIGK